MNRLKAIRFKHLVAVGLIILGLGLTARYAWRTSNAFRALEFARTHHFDQGNPDPELLRAWMNLEYIGVAFSVPQEFIYSELRLTMNPRDSQMTLYDLNRAYRDGQRDADNYPVILEEVRAAIIKYRANPVSTGLKEKGVRPWMNVQYVANSTGIPAEEIFQQIGLPLEGNAYKSLDRLADETHYPDGLDGLLAAIQKVVDNVHE